MANPLLALLPLGVSHGALLLQHHEELLISAQRLLGVFKILLGLSILFIGISKLLGLAIGGRYGWEASVYKRLGTQLTLPPRAARATTGYALP